MEENKNQSPEPPATPLPEQPQVTVSPVAEQPAPGVPQNPVYQQYPTPQLPAHHAPTNPALIVLQWLTYAFWGWAVLALSVLTATVVASFIADADTGEFTPYGVAAVLVLLPIAAVCDYFYSKQEPLKKTGAASIVMVIHAVLFALFAIGSLITAVISLVAMFTSSSDMTGAQSTLISALIIFVFYLATFLRTLNPPQFPQIKRFYITFMVVCIGLIAVLGIAGPAAKAHATRDDRLLESNASSVPSAISEYVRNNKRLPSDLKQLDLDSDTKQLVDKNLLSYQPNTRTPSVKTFGSYSSSSTNSTSKDTTYYYQLCATYKKASKSHYNSGDVYAGDDGYQTYLSSSYHKAGQNCYKLETTDYAY